MSLLPVLHSGGQLLPSDQRNGILAAWVPHIPSLAIVRLPDDVAIEIEMDHGQPFAEFNDALEKTPEY